MKCEYFFFFSSRRRHTRYWRDWSSDVCSSDLVRVEVVLCDSAEELLDECWTCAISATREIVHQFGRELQTSGVERHQAPPEPLVGERELNRLVDATRAARERRLQRIGTVGGE